MNEMVTLTVGARALSRAIKAAALAAGNKKAPEYVRGICIEVRHDALVVAATNRHMLLEAVIDAIDAEFDSEEMPYTGEYKAFICSTAFKGLLPRSGCVRISFAHGHLSCDDRIFCDGSELNSLSVIFPDYRRAIPATAPDRIVTRSDFTADADGIVSIANVQLAQKYITSMLCAAKETTPIHASFGAARRDPVKFYFQEGEVAFTYVIMPLRLMK